MDEAVFLRHLRFGPEGMTTKHFGAMYATEFLQRCLAAGNIGADMMASTVKDTAAEVMAKLSHTILIAKTKARRDIMKSRKGLSLDIYGTFYISSSQEERSQRSDRRLPDGHHSWHELRSAEAWDT